MYLRNVGRLVQFYILQGIILSALLIYGPVFKISGIIDISDTLTVYLYLEVCSIWINPMIYLINECVSWIELSSLGGGYINATWRCGYEFQGGGRWKKGRPAGGGGGGGGSPLKQQPAGYFHTAKRADNPRKSGQRTTSSRKKNMLKNVI